MPFGMMRMLLKFSRTAVLGLLFGISSALAQDAPALSQGETVYAPVYSDVQYGNLDGSGNPSRMPLSAMLSIRNTNPGASITIKSAKYYDSTGKLLREFIEQPKTLAPLESTEVFVEHRDMTGGQGRTSWSSGKHQRRLTHRSSRSSMAISSATSRSPSSA